jgi:hypothetical protein
MPSQAYRRWRTVARAELDELARAHLVSDGTSPHRRFAVQQLNRAYAVLLASQFQGYCRDLHSECAEHLLRTLNPPVQLEAITLAGFTRARQLDRGNAQPDNLKEDYQRLGISLWEVLRAADARADQWRATLGVLNQWRNAIAHRDFDPKKLGGTVTLKRSQVKQWRTVCNDLARLMDAALNVHLLYLTGKHPW